MASFPTLRSGSIAYFPLEDEEVLPTRVVRFNDDSEQRFASSPSLRSFVLSYRDVDGYDLSRMLEFFRARKGRFVDSAFTNLFDITVGGVQHDNMAFDHDDFEYTETKPNRYSFTLRVKQIFHETGP